MQPSPTIELFERAASRPTRRALETDRGTLSYAELMEDSARVAAGLLDGNESLQGRRIAFLVEPGLDYVRLQWGIWRAGGVAVPLCTLHPRPELAYVVEDSEASAVVCHSATEAILSDVAANTSRPLFHAEALSQHELAPMPALHESEPAMILYTSGTTSRPKGVLTSHGCIAAQIRSLEQAWEWSADDRILCVLPLHHLHGIINVLACSLWAGATCVLHSSFDASAVWQSFCDDELTLFMGVPTIYSRLAAAWEKAEESVREEWSRSCGGFRLMVSGSAALPEATLQSWRRISGHLLLERYGMTETGMILSNPLHGERRPGFVGLPLPGVEVRCVDDDGVELQGEGVGEVLVRGRGVFGEYWRRQQETAEAFDDGWFRTGDVASFENGAYRLLGRTSVDIIKTGGYKVSALEIEEVLRTHPGIADCAVVGLPDEDWGERVSAALVASGELPESAELRGWAKERLAVYKVPRSFLVLEDLPRNALGKVTKPALKELFESRGGGVEV